MYDLCLLLVMSTLFQPYNMRYLVYILLYLSKPEMACKQNVLSPSIYEHSSISEHLFLYLEMVMQGTYLAIS